MKKLELKHIAPYLPYGLKIQYLGTEIVELVGFNKNTIYHTTGFFVELPCNIKPILRPLSDLDRDELFKLWSHHIDYLTIERDSLTKEKGIEKYIEELPYSHIKYLLEWHFDVFGLIEKGLAVDIHTISDN